MVGIAPCCESMREMTNDGTIFPLPDQDGYGLRNIGNNDLPNDYNNVTHCPSCGQRITVNRDLLDEESANAMDRDICL
jgi:hypothetical protein